MDTHIYIARLYNTNESFYKIGITNRFSSRKYFFKKAGYSVELIYLSNKKTLDDAFVIEQILHNKNLSNRYIPLTKFGGHTECFERINVNLEKNLTI